MYEIKILYRCNECNTVFGKTLEWNKKYTEYITCPFCNDTDCDEIIQCSICGDYKDESLTYGGICFDCARDEYTSSLGLEFVDKYKKEFYLQWLWGIEKCDEDIESELIRVLRRDMLEYMVNYERIIKEFCFEDMYDWIDFINMKKKERSMCEKKAI